MVTLYATRKAGVDCFAHLHELSLVRFCFYKKNSFSFCSVFICIDKRVLWCALWTVALVLSRKFSSTWCSIWFRPLSSWVWFASFCWASSTASTRWWSLPCWRFTCCSRTKWRSGERDCDARWTTIKTKRTTCDRKFDNPKTTDLILVCREPLIRCWILKRSNVLLLKNSKWIDVRTNNWNVVFFFTILLDDKAFEKYNKSQVIVTITLSFLNFGQQFLLGAGESQSRNKLIFFTIGTLVVLLLMGDAIANKEHTPGDFVMLNAYVVQVAQPLFFLGSAWRFVKNALVISIEKKN